ncbi:hypothetical protein M758_11G158900 [Ceratodon purpureus]|nr:hypothetical protein M758_11G158900 [Ceratodon purpureus]
MASPVFKPSTIIRSVVIVLYFLVFCSIKLSLVLCAGAPVYPPAESPALTPVPTLAPGPAPQWREPGCGLWPVNYQAYEQKAMVSVLQAWKRSDPTRSLYNITNWKENVPPCDRTNKTSGWRGLRCRAVLVNHIDTNSTVCEMSLVTLGAEYRGIIGELVPEIGDLHNLESILISHNPGLTGTIPASIWNLLYLKEVQLINNSLNGSAELNSFKGTTALERVDLSRNLFTRWNWTFTANCLEYLNLSNNCLSGLFNLPFNGFGAFTGPIYTKLITLDLSNNELKGLEGSPISSKFDLPLIQFLNLSSNLLTGLSNNLSRFICNRANGETLSVLDLSNATIGGRLPNWSSMQGPSKLSELYLDKNNITGDLDISAFVKGQSNFSKSLTLLSLKDNNITGVVYADDFAGVRTKFLLQGNPYCSKIWSSEADAIRCTIYCEHKCVYESSNIESNKWKVVVAATSSSSALVLMLAMLCFAIILRRNQKYIRALQKKIRKADINAKSFEYNELRVATKNFAPEMKLGAGAYGAVYKGILPNDVVVAVKQLFLETNEGRDDFLNEVFLISNLQHRNLVNLKGYCLHGKQTLLVYEYVDNCDLDKLLLSSQNSTDSTWNEEAMNWQARRNVCNGVAQGLYYLHASSQFRIIHRDIKASNILLDKNLQPNIADFGLARPIEDARSVIMTQQCAGTLGYLAPEYMCHGQLSEKVDIYSFGVLLLEIVSGKRNRDLTMPEDEVYLPSRAWKLHKENRLLDMMDATLVVSEDETREVQQVLEIAVLCVQNDPEKRPSMFQVAAMLAGDASVEAVVPMDKDMYDSWAERALMDDSDSGENPFFSSSPSLTSSSGSCDPGCASSTAALEQSMSLIRR